MNEIKIEYYAETSFKTKVYFKNIKILKSLNLKKNDVFIDVGSHRGEELNYLKDLCFVHGFECNPLHFENLLSIYGGYRNITLNKNLVTDVHGEKRKCFFKNTNRGGSMSEEYSKINIDKENYILVDTVNLSRYITENNIKNIKALKIDAEGSEFKIIEDLLESRIIEIIDFILFEDHKSKISSKEWHLHRDKIVSKLNTGYKHKILNWY
jgi:FkbM family methyltransferase